MSVLVYSESEKNSFKKSSYEAVSYGKSLADKMGVELICVTFNCSNSQKLKILVLIKFSILKVRTLKSLHVKCIQLYYQKL